MIIENGDETSFSFKNRKSETESLDGANAD